ncbi:pre-toxin TG domain-containing protein [Listeria seeligeri]|uniref:pre-toxin TG domain-containing protein n=1 Tax=Listeria seeligeri TaxID=1640 RepID=UPI0016245778|nr:pre-toxin TG domain-containing protein [Listeria seeligeri]MBC1721222.1 transposase [Listeria seeligeri]
MSIDMYVSKSNAQATSTSQVCQQHLEGYEALQQAISQFTLEPFLKGKAYDSAKAYYSTVLYPLVQGGILLTEATEEAVKKFPERYQSEVDSGDLKQSELEEQIRRVNELIHQTNDLENQVRQSPLSKIDQQIQLQLNQALLEAYQTSKQELEEKLQKLIAFHASSPSIFSEIARLKQAIDQGLAQTKTAWNSTTGTFVVPSKEKLAWANTIRAFQKKKEAQEEPDTTGRTYTRIDLGNGTYVWAWSKDGRTLNQDDIQFTVKHDTWAGKDGGLGKMLAQAEAMKAEAKDFDPVKAIKEIADLLTPLGDGIRVVTGQDPITGEKLSGSERGLSALFIIPLAKIGKYGAKGFKFVTEGVEDLNKLNKKADKVKDVEKSTKKASGADVPKLSTLSEAEKLKIANQYKQTAPIGIPDSAKINAKTMNAGYEQITYKWNDGQFKYEVRWHTRTPGAPIEQGNTWVVQRTVPGNGGNKPQTFFKIGDNEWIEGYKWYDAINARKAGNATPEQIKILDKGHWKE